MKGKVMRKQITMNMTVEEIVTEMCEGNPGAINAMMALVTSGDPQETFVYLLHLDDMNMWGPQIWVAYKDFCKGNLEKLKMAILERDPIMVEFVNKICPDQRAVTGGASSRRPS
jgi:hypothetical protein